MKMKSYQLRIEEGELELLRKDAYRHEMRISDYLRMLIKNQRDADLAEQSQK